MNDAEIARYYLDKINDAKQRNIPFSLSFQSYKNLMHAKRCKYTGEPLFDSVRGRHPNFNTRSIDRIDASKGYVKGNVAAVCHGVNQFKSQFENPTNKISIKSAIKLLKMMQGFPAPQPRGKVFPSAPIVSEINPHKSNEAGSRPSYVENPT